MSGSTAVVFHENCCSFTLSVSQEINSSQLAKYLTQLLSVPSPFSLVSLGEDLMRNESNRINFGIFCGTGFSFFQSPTNPVTVSSAFLPGSII